MSVTVGVLELFHAKGNYSALYVILLVHLKWEGTEFSSIEFSDPRIKTRRQNFDKWSESNVIVS